MITFIDENRSSHGIEPICNVLPIAPSTYYKHVAERRDPTRLSARAQRDIALKPEVARVFAENFAVYGVRKVWRQMQREGLGIARCTVERLMRDMGLAGVIRGKPVRTTFSDSEGKRFAGGKPPERHHARWITSTVSSTHWPLTGCGYQTSLMSPPGAALGFGQCPRHFRHLRSMWPL